MSDPGETGSVSPSLEAVRELERRLAERSERRASTARLVEEAAAEADRIREAARARGEQAAAEARRRALQAAAVDAERIRDEAERRAHALTVAFDARLERTVDLLERLVLPAGEESS